MLKRKRDSDDPTRGEGKQAAMDMAVNDAIAVATSALNKQLSEETTSPDAHVIAQLRNEAGEGTGPPLDLPLNVTVKQLGTLLNGLLHNDEALPYAFYVNDKEVDGGIDAVIREQRLSTENVLEIVYQPQAVFRVNAVTRCSGSMPGHAEAVLSVRFSPNGTRLASASGDTTVRIWDVGSEMPKYTLRGHKNWVLVLAWSANGQYIASGCRNGVVFVWDPITGATVAGPLKGHTKFITGISWEPQHSNARCTRFATSSKDATIRIWDTVQRRSIMTLGGHTHSVTCVQWGGEGLIYTASQDRSIKVWSATDGKLCRTLSGHAHWVNTMALNTGYALRTGSFDHTGKLPSCTPEEGQAIALKRYIAAKAGGEEMLVSGSDDYTMHLWLPTTSKKPVARMTGHQGQINEVSFSPDGRLVASASFDKSVKLWEAKTGKFLTSYRGHVGAVYQVCWSGDSRLLVSGSKDSTMKVWSVKTKKLAFDLPGHADEVYTVDWSPDGVKVASGSKDKLIKLWRT